jgi:hypothetical protein
MMGIVCSYEVKGTSEGERTTKMFSCELCENALRGYDVTLTTLEKVELCGDCVEHLRESGQVLLASRFVGLRD